MGGPLSTQVSFFLLYQIISTRRQSSTLKLKISFFSHNIIFTSDFIAKNRSSVNNLTIKLNVRLLYMLQRYCFPLLEQKRQYVTAVKIQGKSNVFFVGQT